MNPERILIFELNWLGDILFSFPLIRAIRGRFPESFIACVVVPRYAELLVNNPWVNDIHLLSDDNSLRSLNEKLSFIRIIREEKYDMCFLLKPSRMKAIIGTLANIPERIGFKGKFSPLTREVEAPWGTLHRVDQLLALAGAVGVENTDGTYEYFVNSTDEENAKKILRDSGGGIRKIVVLNPGGNWDAKVWPKENFIELAEKLLTRFNDIEIAVTGAKKDIDASGEIVKNVKSLRCYSLAGKTGLNDLAAIFKKSSLVISSDSGPLHLASAVASPTIGLYGPTSYKITGPRGRGENIIISREPEEREIPCYVDECDTDYKCMTNIKVDAVYKAAGEVISNQNDEH